MRLQTPTKKVVGCKVLQFIHKMKIKKMLVTKLYGANTQKLLQEKEMNQGKNFVSGHNLLEQSLLNACATCEPFDGP